MKLKKGDYAIITAVLAASLTLSLIFTGSSASATTAVVMQDNQVIKKIDLSALKSPVTFSVGGDYNDLIIAEPGRIRFQEANCPDQVCVQTGWLTRPGQIAVCLPNKLSIRIEGNSSSGDQVDIIVK